MNNTIIFGDHRSRLSTLLVAATLREAQKLRKLRIAAICDISPVPAHSWPVTAGHDILVYTLKRLLNPRLSFANQRPLSYDLNRIAKAYHVPIITPINRSINDPDFIAKLVADFSPSFGFSFWCGQIFRAQLIGVFEQVVNYHDSLLPAYRGVAATCWSLYHGEAKSGFTLHRINEKIDDGPILLQEAIPVRPETTCSDLQLNKARLAASRMHSVIDRMVAGDAGTPQQGMAAYFSGKDYDAITTVTSPASLTYREYTRRLRAFQRVEIRLNEEWLPVTRIQKISGLSPSSDFFTFSTRDGVKIRPTRIAHMPVSLYPIFRWLVKKKLFY